MSPKLNKGHLLLRAQALPEDKAKILLNFLTSFCNADDKLWAGINTGLRALENETRTATGKETKTTQTEGK
jgi:hypothetical protein